MHQARTWQAVTACSCGIPQNSYSHEGNTLAQHPPAQNHLTVDEVVILYVDERSTVGCASLWPVLDRAA